MQGSAKSFSFFLFFFFRGMGVWCLMRVGIVLFCRRDEGVGMYVCDGVDIEMD